MNKKEIIQTLRAEIKGRGITRYQLAKNAGLRESTLQRLDEDGWGQQIETLCRIAEAIGLQITITSKSSS